jgi:hypothetical protein
MERFGKLSADRIPPGTFEAPKENEVAGMIFSVQLGRKLQGEYPVIADDYRSGESMAEIIRKYDLTEIYNVTYETARMAVRYALGGYDGQIKIAKGDGFPGLIESIEEKKKIANEHNSATGRKVGLDLRDSKKGIFALSSATKSEIGRKSGNAQLEKGIGIHAQTIDERRRLGRVAAESQGKTVFSDEEVAFIKEKIIDPEYQRKTRINAKKLSNILNSTFHRGDEIRTPKSVKKIVHKLNSGERS